MLQELRKGWVILAYDAVILNVQELLVQCHCRVLQDMYLQQHHCEDVRSVMMLHFRFCIKIVIGWLIYRTVLLHPTSEWWDV